MMSFEKPKLLLFLSHSGSDTDKTFELKQKIEQSQSAQDAGLEVWLDQDIKGLKAGEQWQTQLEEVITKTSTAFAVYLGNKGVENWVAKEVELALSRTVGDKNYPFIPLLSKDVRSSLLPPFAGQYHAIRDIDTDEKAIKTLINIATGKEPYELVDLLMEGESPFVGLSAFGIKQSHLFFGRERERKELADKLKSSNLLAVIGDSGSGKSSLVRAGVIPDFLGGRYIDNDKTRVVIETRPAGDAFEYLASVLATLSKDRSIKKSVKGQDPQEIYDIIEVLFEPHSQLILYIDQFEELFTLCKQEIRKPFIDLLLYLISNNGTLSIKVIYTMRRDYYNLVSKYEDFYALSQSEDHHFLVKRMSGEGIKDAIIKPLKLTAYAELDIENFASHVLQNVGDKAGDLTLLQIALTQTWKKREKFRGDLISIYEEIGGITGALPKLAKDTYESLDKEKKAGIKNIFLRLVTSGNTGGMTRRIADRSEFNEEQWELIKHLTSALDAKGDIDTKGESVLGRVLVISGEEGDESVELVHEALITQWGDYQTWIQDALEKDILPIHAKVIAKTKEWIKDKRKNRLINGIELDEAKRLQDVGDELLSDDERLFIDESISREKGNTFILLGLITLLIIVSATAVLFGYSANESEKIAKINEQNATAQAKIAKKETDKALQEKNKAQERLYRSFMQQGITARDYLEEPIKAKSYFAKAVAESSNKIEEIDAKIAYKSIFKDLKTINIFDFNGDLINWTFDSELNKVLNWSGDVIKLWSTKRNQLIQEYDHKKLNYAEYYEKSKRVLSWGSDTIKLWSTKNNQPIKEYDHTRLGNAEYYEKSKRVLSWGGDTIKLWSTKSNQPIKEYDHKKLNDAEYYEKSKRVLSWGGDTIKICNILTDTTPINKISKELCHPGVKYLEYNQNVNRIFSLGDNGVKVWDAKSYDELQYFPHLNVEKFNVNTKGDTVIGWGDDTIYVWSIKSPKPLHTLDHLLVTRVVFNKKNDRILSISNNQAKLWNTITGDLLTTIKFDNFYPIIQIRFIHNDTMIFSESQYTVKLWSKDGKLLKVFKKMFISSDVETILNKKGDKILFFDGKRGQIVSSAIQDPFIYLKDKEGSLKNILFSNTYNEILSWNDKIIKLWTLKSKLSLQKFEHNKVNGVTLNQRGDKILSAGGNIIKLWNKKSNVPIQTYEHNYVEGVQFIKESDKFMSWGGDTIKLWNTINRYPEAQIEHEGVLHAEFNEKGDKIFSRSLFDVKLSSVHKHQLKPIKIININFDNNDLYIPAFNKKTNIIAIINKDIIELWDAKKNDAIVKFPHNHEYIMALEFNQEGDKVFSLGKKNITTWNINDINKVNEIITHNLGRLNTSSSMGGNYIISLDGELLKQEFLTPGGDRASTPNFEHWAKLWSTINHYPLHSFYLSGGDKISFTGNNSNWVFIKDEGDATFEWINLYHLYDDKDKTDHKDYPLKTEIEYGIDIFNVNNIKVLSREEWLRKKNL